MTNAVYALIGLWVLLPTVFFILLRWDKRQRAKWVKFSCACGRPSYMSEPMYTHSPQGCGPQREMIG